MSSTTTTAKPTTIGVELEFLVVNTKHNPTDAQASLEDNRWPPVPNPKAHPDHLESESMLEICKLIAAQGHRVACALKNTHSQNPLMTTHGGVLLREIKTDHGFEIKPISFHPDNAKDEDIQDYRVWNIKLDKSPKKLPLCFTTWNFELEESITSTLEYPVLEMRTPIISKPTQQKDFLDMVETLRKNFKISINPNCGMHIHAGYQSDPPRASEDLYRAKKVVAIVRLLEEPFILELCHPDRRLANQLKLIRDKSELATNAGKVLGKLVPNPKFGKDLLESISKFRSELEDRCPKEGSVFRFLELLFSQPVKEDEEDLDLQEDLQDPYGRRTCLALSLALKTIEFRYFECTFESSMIKFWIEFVRQIFSICNKPEVEFEKEFKNLYEMATRKGKKPSWENWLKALGLSEYQNTCADYKKICKKLPLDESIILPKSFCF